MRWCCTCKDVSLLKTINKKKKDVEKIQVEGALITLGEHGVVVNEG